MFVGKTSGRRRSTTVSLWNSIHNKQSKFCLFDHREANFFPKSTKATIRGNIELREAEVRKHRCQDLFRTLRSLLARPKSFEECSAMRKIGISRAEEFCQLHKL
jgi:hypothetical protein